MDRIPGAKYRKRDNGEKPMKKLIQGLREFKTNYVSTHRELLENLAHGQHPRVLFITCSDSRIEPNLVTQTDLGDLFVIRNAGNIIPPYGAANGGEGASIEYAVHALGINQIVVCGHSHCGAMKGLLHLNKLQEEMPLVYDWLKHAEATRRLIKENYSHYSDEELLEITIAENVLIQIDNLKTYPVIHSKIHQHKLQIYAWVYHIETGEVLAYDPETHAYIPPQSQIMDSAPMESSPNVSANTRTIVSNAPPVACELPAVYELEPAFGIASESPPPPQEIKEIRRDTNIDALPWLSPEQAERIYRGSAAKR
jgi:carbonic anhydrase